MPIDLDTFLVALYTIVDDLSQQAAAVKAARRDPGLQCRTARCSPWRCARNGGGARSAPFCAMSATTGEPTFPGS